MPRCVATAEFAYVKLWFLGTVYYGLKIRQEVGTLLTDLEQYQRAVGIVITL